MELSGALAADDMLRYSAEIADAIQTLKGVPYCIFCDSRLQLPLSPEAAAVLSSAKEFSAAQPNFIGSAVLVSTSMVAMQHRRTSTEGHVMGTELISDDPAACWKHLRRLQTAHAQ